VAKHHLTRDARPTESSGPGVSVMQTEPMDRIHVLVGEKASLSDLRPGKVLPWIVPKAAQVGDRAALFFPSSGFVGFAEIKSAPKPDLLGRRPAYSADIRVEGCFKKAVPLNRLTEELRGWRWLTYPRSYTTVHGLQAGTLVTALYAAAGGPRPQPADVRALEGLLREVRAVTRARSGRLRSQALAEAAGVCAVCDTDFSKVLGGRGECVLQVHHRKQLSASKAPRLTRLADLAVVCANCHALIHKDPQEALPVERLRRMLARA